MKENWNMRIKVQFDCEEKYLAEISEGLLSMSQGVMAQPTRSYNNYFAMYAGDMSTIESMNNF